MGERIKLARPINLSELEVGKIFDGDELIIDRRYDSENNVERMDTVRNEVIKSNGEWNDIRGFLYDFTRDENGMVKEIHCNGYREISSREKNYQALARSLKNKGLWREDRPS